MSYDPYQPCPAGTGKKVKFCCSQLGPELDKMDRMLEGEQRIACRDHAAKLIKKHGPRPCLLATKSIVELELQDLDACQETLDTYVSEHPENPVGAASYALLEAARGHLNMAVDRLQDSLAVCREEIPGRVYDVVGAVGQALLLEGKILAGRGHLILQVIMSRGEDQEPIRWLRRLNSDPSISLLLKQDLRWKEPPADDPRRQQFEEAMEPAANGCWRTSIERLSTLLDGVGLRQEALYNMAAMQCYLADDEAPKTLRRYAASGVPLDDAVEAEALAQLLEPSDEEEEGVRGLVRVRWEVSEPESLLERLVSDPCCEALPDFLVQRARVGEGPPPKAIFRLLDRPLPDTGVGIAAEDIPKIRGELRVYGRQTDQAAQLEMATVRRPGFEQLLDDVQQIAGDAIGERSEEVIDNVPTIADEMTWNWRIPNDTPVDHRDALLNSQRQWMMVEHWPTLPQPVLDGRAPLDVKGDPKYRVRLSASVLLWELSAQQQGWTVDFAPLRKKLDITRSDKIDLPEGGVNHVPLVRLARLDIEQLDDETLQRAFRRAVAHRALVAVRRLGEEILRRDPAPAESKQPQIDRAEIHAVLGSMVSDKAKAMQHLHKAQEIAAATGRSPAQYLLAELELRFERRELDAAGNLLRKLEQQHINEKGVADALASILYNHGLIDAAGQPIGPLRSPSAAGQQPPAAPAAGSGIWTPGGAESGSPAPEEQPQEKGKLWVPGME